MTEYNPDNYLPTIDAILGVADLEQITVKKVRNALQELFGVDLQPHKKEINDFIMERYYKLVDERKEEAEDVEKKRKSDLEKKDKLMAAKLQASLNGSRTLRETKAGKVSKKTSKKKANGEKRAAPNNAFNRPMKLSYKLAALLDVEMLSRPQIVKQLWDYIKKNDMQNPKNKREIMCDDKFQQVFGKKMISMFEMNKLLSNHIFAPDDLVGEGTTKTVKKEVKKEAEKEVKTEISEDDDDDDDDSASDSDISEFSEEET